MKYKCLLLDHDDTVVDSTRDIHYPSFLEVLAAIRPDMTMSLEEFYKLNFHPGFIPLCRELLGFNDEEMDFEVSSWKAYIKNHTPDTFPGIKELLWDFVDAGGKVFVVSHSAELEILRHYKELGLPTPDHVYGFDYPEHQRKPYPWPVEDIIVRYGFSKDEMIMVDDLKPGKIMADEAGIDFVAVGWAHKISDLVDEMKSTSIYYCDSVDQLREIIFRD